MSGPGHAADRRVVVGVGLSSRATVGEVRALLDEALGAHRLGLADVEAIATRASLAGTTVALAVATSTADVVR
jgi:hypothetical protein